MREYETVYILKPDLSADRWKKVSDRIEKIFSDTNSEMIEKKDWGKKKLAYRIGSDFYGHYFYVNFKTESNPIPELERTLRYEEEVIRFLTVRLEAHDAKDGKPKKMTHVEDLNVRVEDPHPFRSMDRVRHPKFDRDEPRQGGFNAEERE